MFQDPDFNGVELSHLPSVELSFSAFYMGGVKALANGKVEVGVVIRSIRVWETEHRRVCVCVCVCVFRHRNRSY